MELTRLQKIAAALVVFGNALLTAVLVITECDWTDVEKAVAYLVVNTTVAFAVALYAHFRPTVPAYPVAVGFTFLAWTSSVFDLLSSHGVFGLTKDKALVVQGVLVAGVALVALFVTQSKVTPEADARARENAAIAASRRRP